MYLEFGALENVLAMKSDNRNNLKLKNKRNRKRRKVYTLFSHCPNPLRTQGYFFAAVWWEIIPYEPPLHLI